MTKGFKKYLLWFAQDHVDFRVAEIKSIIKLFDLELKFCNFQPKKPYWIIELPNEDEARKLASRSVSLRCILELWSYAKEKNEIHSNLKNYIEENKNTDKYFKETSSFKITVETYNKHFTQKEKVQKIEMFNYLPLLGKVNLKTPNVEWWYIEFYGMNPCEVSIEPGSIIFGRWIADGQRNLIKELSLKNRKFIGNTSMDAQLSLLMANQALVKPYDLVLDPFVGTGSLLVSAAKFGGYVIGADIDYMMVHAKTRPSRITQKVRENDESIRTNLKQYNCEKFFIDVLVSDFSNPIWKDNIEFDSIITDPPYGIREATTKIETKFSEKVNSRDPNAPHYPSTSPYSLRNLYMDLLNFSVKHLKKEGRLVCWFPFHREDYSEEIIPQHPCLEVVANSEQRLCGQTSRRLLTYTKIHNLEDSEYGKDQILSFSDFRERYFCSSEQTRKERKIQRERLREIGKMEALKHGKTLDENGKVVKFLKP